MQNWMKYVLQATVISGGLLTLGTGIASAAENVNPDLPASVLDQQVLTPAVSGIVDAVKQARPLQQVETSSQDALRPAADTAAGAPTLKTPVGPIHAVPVELFQSVPTQIDEIVKETREPDLHAPLGAEIGATEVPLLPVLSRMETVRDSLPVTLVDGTLPAPVPPMSGTITTDPLDPEAGTRVTALHADAPTVATTYDARGPVTPSTIADTPVSALPQPSGVPAAGDSLLPTTLPTTGGVPIVGQLTTLTQQDPLLTQGQTPASSPVSSLTTNGTPALSAMQKFVGSITTLLRR